MKVPHMLVYANGSLINSLINCSYILLPPPPRTANDLWLFSPLLSSSLLHYLNAYIH